MRSFSLFPASGPARLSAALVLLALLWLAVCWAVSLP